MVSSYYSLGISIRPIGIGKRLLGVVHVKHGIPNSAMLGMWGWMLSFLQEHLFAELPSNEAVAVMKVFHKLQAVVASLVVEGFILTEREAIKRASG